MAQLDHGDESNMCETQRCKVLLCCRPMFYRPASRTVCTTRLEQFIQLVGKMLWLEQVNGLVGMWWLVPPLHEKNLHAAAAPSGNKQLASTRVWNFHSGEWFCRSLISLLSYIHISPANGSWDTLKNGKSSPFFQAVLYRTGSASWLLKLGCPGCRRNRHPVVRHSSHSPRAGHHSYHSRLTPPDRCNPHLFISTSHIVVRECASCTCLHAVPSQKNDWRNKNMLLPHRRCVDK